ncbi:MAG TPA: hypothetical protein VLH61_08430 [Bacteroidales bacterium]|nr:hypothetical protein [Bacteroidales bacterium]
MKNILYLVYRMPILLVFFIFAGNSVLSQTVIAFRQKKIFAGQSIHVLDTLSIDARHFQILGPDSLPLDSAFFHLDPASAKLRLRIPDFWQTDSLVVSYRVLPFMLSIPFFHRDTVLAYERDILARPAFLRNPPVLPTHGLLNVGGITSSGSIARGITIGNRQDLSVQSEMNLQLTGSLSHEIQINAALSDQDIPFQPDGTTRQLHEFDRVYIQLSGHGGQFTAGDFDFDRPESHFMTFSRRAQGGKGLYNTKAHDAGLMPNADVQISASAAIAKGNFVRNHISVVEGNQGPYRLSGNNNEGFVIVLSGTERVYLNGVLLTRGMDQDYIIDYNQAEITFTSRRIITRECRIVVEFEYAKRNYARSVVFTGARATTDRSSLRINFFSEQDHKNQHLFQELTEDQISKLSRIGDNLDQAYDWNVQNIGFQSDRVMYMMIDSLGFDSVFVASQDPLRAVFQVGFSFVGEGNGSYRQVLTAANGRAFQWIAPINGQKQGTHDPTIQLVTPKRKQMLTIGSDFRVGSRSSAGFELAMSNNNLNLFSDLDRNNDSGQGILFKLNHEIPIRSKGLEQWTLQFAGSHEWVSRNFSQIEPFRPLEFQRDWNLDALQSTAPENNTNISLKLTGDRIGSINYSLRSFQGGPAFRGIMNLAETRLALGKTRVNFSGSLLNSYGQKETDFYRHLAGISRPILFFKAGFEHQMEHNRRRNAGEQSLSLISSFFDEWLFFLTNQEDSRNRFRLYYKVRNRRLPAGTRFIDESIAREYGLSYELMRNPEQRLSVLVNSRSLSFQGDPQNSQENTMGGRISYFSRWFDGTVVSNLFYETGSGMERKREYIFMKVPAGQGVFSWIDYNGNGILELDEFELAKFPDQANFIRVFIPTDQFTRVFSTTLSQTISLEPGIAWSERKGIKGFLSRFSNQASIRIDQKNLGGISLRNINPFGYNLADTMLVALNSAFRNTIFYNRSAGVFSFDMTWSDNQTKMLLSNGFENRALRRIMLRARYNFNREISLSAQAELEETYNRSEFFLQRNFLVRANQAGPELSFQFENRLRISCSFMFSEKVNKSGITGERAQIKSLGGELSYSFPARGRFTGRFQIAEIDFPFNRNTPVAFEMLEGLNPGSNNLWTVTWQQNLNAWLQIDLTYHGRKSAGARAVHTGSMLVRAMF